MPLHTIDHIELWVGNAAQAAYHLRHALGFADVAYAGLETGLRDRVSHVLQQSKVVTAATAASSCRSTSLPRAPKSQIDEYRRVDGASRSRTTVRDGSRCELRAVSP